jgi:DNA polymerase III epsilon subunit-like protein
MHSSSWVIIDTETTGIQTPIYAVEIAAQRMQGWARAGAPFRVLLNHDVPIEPQAEAVHGYTRDYLRQHGLPPDGAHARFRDYVGALPLVAHNLSYDWDRVLRPEYERLRLPVAGRRGFCAMTLARRVVAETAGVGLAQLAAKFMRGRTVAHNALSDTLMVVELFEQVYGPRLERAGVNSFAAVTEFARRTPVAGCLELVRGTMRRG